MARKSTGQAAPAKASRAQAAPRRKPAAVPNDEAIALRSIMVIYREFEQVARRSDISMAQYRTLLYLQHGARRAGEISAAAAVTRPTVSLLLNSLRARGWIESIADNDDGRATLVLITDKGKARIEAFEADLADAIIPLTEGIDVQNFYAALRQIYRLLGKAKGDWLSKIESEI